MNNTTMPSESTRQYMRFNNWHLVRIDYIFWAMTFDEGQRTFIRRLRLASVSVVVGFAMLLFGVFLDIKSTVFFVTWDKLLILIGSWVGFLGIMLSWYSSFKLRYLLWDYVRERKFRICPSCGYSSLGSQVCCSECGIRLCNINLREVWRHILGMGLLQCEKQ